MDRYVSTKAVMGVLLEEYERKALEMMVVDTGEAFIEAKASLETIRTIIDGVVNLLPDNKQEQFRKKLFNHYKSTAVLTTLNMKDTEE